MSIITLMIIESQPMKILNMIRIACSVLALAACSTWLPVAAEAAQNPARTLACTLGRATNLDPRKDQSMAEIRYEGSYKFTLFLPAAPIQKQPPMGEDMPIEPVDPATRVIDDPASLRRGVPEGFSRVVDLWPERVELVQPIQPPLVHFIVINQIDADGGTANLFMTTASDIAAMNLQTVYQGPCTIAYGPG